MNRKCIFQVNLHFWKNQLEANSVTKNKLETNIKTLKAKIASVMEKQFAGIDVENIKQQYNAAKKSSSNDEILALEKKRMEIQNKQYVSKLQVKAIKQRLS